MSMHTVRNRPNIKNEKDRTVRIHGVPVYCINKAAVSYYVPAKLIVAVLQTEAGWPGMESLNHNGTKDYGPMQINTIWVNRVKKYGYTQETVRDDPCVNVWIGSWILSQAIANEASYWRGVGDYHSHTESHNQTYQRAVIQRYQTLDRVFRTH
jgi:hypothetical protein